MFDDSSLTHFFFFSEIINQCTKFNLSIFVHFGFFYPPTVNEQDFNIFLTCFLLAFAVIFALINLSKYVAEYFKLFPLFFPIKSRTEEKDEIFHASGYNVIFLLGNYFPDFGVEYWEYTVKRQVNRSASKSGSSVYISRKKQRTRKITVKPETSTQITVQFEPSIDLVDLLRQKHMNSIMSKIRSF